MILILLLQIKFVVDNSLKRLARRLRCLGIDTVECPSCSPKQVKLQEQGHEMHKLSDGEKKKGRGRCGV